jgi:hypothetical protein
LREFARLERRRFFLMESDDNGFAACDLFAPSRSEFQLVCPFSLRHPERVERAMEKIEVIEMLFVLLPKQFAFLFRRFRARRFLKKVAQRLFANIDRLAANRGEQAAFVYHALVKARLVHDQIGNSDALAIGLAVAREEFSRAGFGGGQVAENLLVRTRALLRRCQHIGEFVVAGQRRIVCAGETCRVRATAKRHPCNPQTSILRMHGCRDHPVARAGITDILRAQFHQREPRRFGHCAEQRPRPFGCLVGLPLKGSKLQRLVKRAVQPPD